MFENMLLFICTGVLMLILLNYINTSDLFLFSQLKDQADVVKTAAALNNIKNSLEHVNKCKKLYQQKHKDLIESEESLTKAGLAADKTDKVGSICNMFFTQRFNHCSIRFRIYTYFLVVNRNSFLLT